MQLPAVSKPSGSAAGGGTAGPGEPGFELGLEGRVEFEVAGQFVKVGALHEVLLVDHQHTGHVHFRGHFRGTGGTRHIGRIQRLVQLGVQPALGFTVAGQFAEFAFDQFALALVDMAIGLGRSHQRLENALAVQLHFGRRQTINYLRLALGLSLIHI